MELIRHHVRDDLVRLLNLPGRQRVAVLVESIGDEAGSVEDTPKETHSQEEQQRQSGAVSGKGLLKSYGEGGMNTDYS